MFEESSKNSQQKSECLLPNKDQMCCLLLVAGWVFEDDLLERPNGTLDPESCSECAAGGFSESHVDEETKGGGEGISDGFLFFNHVYRHWLPSLVAYFLLLQKWFWMCPFIGKAGKKNATCSFLQAMAEKAGTLPFVATPTNLCNPQQLWWQGNQTYASTVGETQSFSCQVLKSFRFRAKEIAWRTPCRDQVGFQKDVCFFLLMSLSWDLSVKIGSWCFFFQHLPGMQTGDSFWPTGLKASTGSEITNSSWCLCRMGPQRSLQVRSWWVDDAIGVLANSKAQNGDTPRPTVILPSFFSKQSSAKNWRWHDCGSWNDCDLWIE